MILSPFNLKSYASLALVWNECIKLAIMSNAMLLASSCVENSIPICPGDIET